jgi:hypothetical protein
VKESSRGMDRRFLHVDIDLREPTGTAPPPNKRGGGGLVLFCNALGHARVGPRGISSCVGAAKYRRWQYWREMRINSGRENKHGKLLPSFIHPSQLKSLIHLINSDMHEKHIVRLTSAGCIAQRLRWPVYACL